MGLRTILLALLVAGCGAAEGWQDTAELVAGALGPEQCAFVATYEYELTDGAGGCTGATGTITIEPGRGTCAFETFSLHGRPGIGFLECDPAEGVCEGHWSDSATQCTWHLVLTPVD